MMCLVCCLMGLAVCCRCALRPLRPLGASDRRSAFRDRNRRREVGGTIEDQDPTTIFGRELGLITSLEARRDGKFVLGNVEAVAVLFLVIVEQRPRQWEQAGAEAHRAAEAHHRRSEEHTSELQSLMCISSAAFCLNTKK